MSDSSIEVPLQPSVEELITKICSEKSTQPPDVSARRALTTITEESAIEILKNIACSSTIRSFSRYIHYMVKLKSDAGTSPMNTCILPQKRSPPISSTDRSPQQQKYIHYNSPKLEQSVAVRTPPASNSHVRTIPDYFPRSPDDGYGSLVSKRITSYTNSGLEDAVPNNDPCHVAESSKAANRVQKQLFFSSGCELDDTDHDKGVSQHLFDSSNTSHGLTVVQMQPSLALCSSSKGTNTSPFNDTDHGKGVSQHLFDSSNTSHGFTVVQMQPSLALCSSSKGTNTSPFNDTYHGKGVSQHLFDSSNTSHGFTVVQMQPSLALCSSSKGTNTSPFNDISSATHNGFTMVQIQPSLALYSSSKGTNASHFNGISSGPHNGVTVVQKQPTLALCPSSKGTNPSHFNNISNASHNGSPILVQRTLSPCKNIAGPTNSLAISPQSLLLAELEFRKMFMVYSYVGRKKLEDVVSVEDAIEIKKMKTLTMFDFEDKIWAKYGCKFCEPRDRAMHLDWDSGKTHLYRCYVSMDGTYKFKGPYLDTKRNHVQRELGDDNVLIVQVIEDPDTSDMRSNHCSFTAAHNIIFGGISVGLRPYRLLAFKDARENKSRKVHDTKKPWSTYQLKCFFVRKESHAPWVEKDNSILLGKTNHEARCLFMHVHTVSSMAKYVSRCQLALSNTTKLHVDLASVHVERIDDILCRDENGCVVLDEDGKPMIHTDGTGFISEDLAILCAKDFLEAKGSKDGGYEFLNLHKLEEESFGIKGKESSLLEPPLLVQCRLFKEGLAVKGTLLVNKKLKPRTIQVRPSMIKVEKDTTLSNSTSFSSLEICCISQKPRTANLSKNLIALLTVGGVPKDYFLQSLNITLQETQKVSSSMRAAVKVGLNYRQMDDSATSVAMIGSGIPLNEPYLQYRLAILATEERKALRGGRIPVKESYYLLGTADPTGTLNSDEVCVILDNGQISGKVLVYRNPGLHFGDVHVLKARYVEKLEEYVGNAKYGIFFSTKGKRSVGSEIANGDFDGDMYWVCRNPQLLHYFKASEPWKKIHSAPSAPTKKPSELPYDELEAEVLAQLFSALKANGVIGKAADSWLAFVDLYLTLGENDTEGKRRLKEKMLKLVDLYYDAVDAPKHGKMVDIPTSLLPQKYPHFMEKKNSYNSSSVLGEIYDTVKNYQPENALRREIWKLSCFNVEVPEPVLRLWKDRYDSYRHEMSKALQSGDESKSKSANIVTNKYKQMLYEADNFASSSRKLEDVYTEALAIYHVAYDTAQRYADVGKCGFAWKVAGEALCAFHEANTPGRSIPFKVDVLSLFM